MTDHLLGLAAGKLVHHLGNLLRRLGFSTEELQPHDDEKTHQPAGHQQFHRKGVVNGSRGMGGLDAHNMQYLCHCAAK